MLYTITSLNATRVVRNAQKGKAGYLDTYLRPFIQKLYITLFSRITYPGCFEFWGKIGWFTPSFRISYPLLRILLYRRAFPIRILIVLLMGNPAAFLADAAIRY